MFKKPFKVKSNCQMKMSDRKKLQVEINRQFPQLTEELLNCVLPSKEAIVQLKVISYSKKPITIYCLQKLPILFEIKNTFYPTVYLLWNVQDLVYTFTTHPEILQVLVRGADLMLPGVVLPEGREVEAYGRLQRGDRVAVNLTSNRAAVAVGVAANSSYDMWARRGKCVEILHCYGDHLSTYGTNLPVPDLGPVIESRACVRPLSSKDQSKDSGFQYLDKITGKSYSSELIKKPSSEKPGNSLSFNGGTSNLESDLVETKELQHTAVELPFKTDHTYELQIKQTEYKGNFDVANLTMDDILRYSFLKSLKTTLNKVELPLLTCNFYKLHMVPACPKGKTIDIKKTQYKKLSKFLDKMAEAGVIKVESLQKGVQSITKIDYNSEILKDFVDSLSDKEEANSKVNGSTGNKLCAPEISEKYIVTASVLPLFRVYDCNKRDSLTSSEVRSILGNYIKDKNLQNPTNKTKVILDEVLQKATNSPKYVEVLPRDELVSKVFVQMGNAYKFQSSTDTVIKNPEIKGKLQPIDIKVGTRTGNKKVTLVNNLELYNINLADFSKECQHGAAASTTINTMPFAKSSQLQIQGNQVEFIRKLLMEKYKIPLRYLRGLENASKKKKS